MTSTEDAPVVKLTKNQKHYAKLIQDPERLARRRENQRLHNQKRREERKRMIESGELVIEPKPRKKVVERQKHTIQERVIAYMKRINKELAKEAGTPEPPKRKGRPPKHTY